MIRGLGTDIVNVNRIRDAMLRPGFVERVLTQKEREREISAEFVAGRWAAKEAIFKAIGDLTWQEIEIWGERGEEPEIRLLVDDARKSYRILLSISHERDYAMATALVLDA